MQTWETPWSKQDWFADLSPKSVDILKELAVTNATKMIVSVDDKILELKIKEIQAGAEQCQAQGLDS